jgi:hypothetical protein
VNQALTFSKQGRMVAFGASNLLKRIPQAKHGGFFVPSTLGVDVIRGNPNKSAFLERFETPSTRNGVAFKLKNSRGVMTDILSLNDLNTTINHEPRVQDVLLAEKLGFERPRNIRKAIERNRAELESYGSICSTVEQIPDMAGRPGKTYYLNEGQALVICALSRTPKAAEIRKAIIEVFMAWRRGMLDTVQTTHKAKQLALPYPRKPIDAKAIHALCDELFTILGHFQIMNQQIPASQAKKKINKLLLDAADASTSNIVKEVIFHA